MHLQMQQEENNPLTKTTNRHLNSFFSVNLLRLLIFGNVNLVMFSQSFSRTMGINLQSKCEEN